MIRHLLILGLLVLAPGAVRGHDVWLLPTASETPIDIGELVKVELWQGHAPQPEPLARNERKLLRLEALGPAGRVLDLPGLDGGRPAGVFRPQQAGLWRIVYEGRPSLYRLPADRFESYLEEEGLDHVLGERRRLSREGQEGREMVSRSLKALVRVGDGDGDDEPAGLPVELVLERMSSALVQLRLLVFGEPADGALVDLLPLDPREEIGATGSEQDRLAARTAAEGVVSFRFEPSSSPRRWMAAAVIARSSTSPRARWRAYFTTLTFTTPAPAATTSRRSP